MITTANKQRILEAIATNRANYPSDAKHAAALGISASVYNSLKKGQTDKALSDANWVNIARRLDVNLRDSIEWKGARTATFDYITTQLEACQVAPHAGAWIETVTPRAARSSTRRSPCGSVD